MDFGSKEIIGPKGRLISWQRHSNLAKACDYLTLKKEFQRSLRELSCSDIYNLACYLEDLVAQSKLSSIVQNSLFAGAVGAFLAVTFPLITDVSVRSIPSALIPFAGGILIGILLVAITIFAFPSLASYVKRVQCYKFYISLLEDYKTSQASRVAVRHSKVTVQRIEIKKHKALALTGGKNENR